MNLYYIIIVLLVDIINLISLPLILRFKNSLKTKAKKFLDLDVS